MSNIVSYPCTLLLLLTCLPCSGRLAHFEHLVKTRLDTFSDAFLALGNRRPNAPEVEPEDHDKYPLVTWWTKDDWNDFIGNKNGNSPTGSDDPETEGTVSRKFYFVQNKDGRTVSSTRLDKIRAFARGIFAEMVVQKVAPLSWNTGVPENLREDFCRRLEAKYPELSYCEDHWKANQIAILIYSNYKTYRHEYFAPLADAARKAKTAAKKVKREHQEEGEGAKVSAEDASTSGRPAPPQSDRVSSQATAGSSIDPSTISLGSKRPAKPVARSLMPPAKKLAIGCSPL